MKRNSEKRRKKLSRRDFVRATAAGVSAAALAGLGAETVEGAAAPRHWDKEADVVAIGAGCAGLAAAIQATEDGASVIVVDANTDIGGHAILNGGYIALGGGTSLQRKYGIEDSPDLLFADLTDWSIVEPNGFPDYRYNDREIIRAYADNSGPTLEWLIAHGVRFVDMAPSNIGGAYMVGNSVPRMHVIAAMAWPLVSTGKAVDPAHQTTMNSGVGMMRPLEAFAKKLGVQILLQHKMTSIIRQNPFSGRVLGITATNQGKAVNIRARKGVIIATGGHTSNVNFRRIFDPRLTEEYQVPGEPYSYQDASGEIAAMAMGASLWGACHQSQELGPRIAKTGKIGCQYGLGPAGTELWEPTSPVFPLARASGLRVRTFQDVILVNQTGLRFYDEMADSYPGNNAGNGPPQPYTHGSYLNAVNIKYSPSNFINAALAGSGDGSNGGGPIWAIFDANAVTREGWTVTPPHVDIAAGFFFSADSVAELAGKIVMKYQRKPMSASVLQETVTRYNSFVDAGKDADFGKPTPNFKIQTPPFYAAWATPVVHDTRSGLRINAKCQVIDLDGNLIQSLYCAGESAGGFNMHGVGRCSVQGRIAGKNAAIETPETSKA